jgi:hypothetical protein
MENARLNQRVIILAISFLFILAAVVPTRASVTQLGSPAFVTNTNTLGFTVPAGVNRILLVVASDENATDISTVTFGVSPLTQRAEHNDGAAVDSIFTLNLGPGGSTTATITVVSTGTTPNNASFIGAIAFDGVNQAAPVTNIQAVDNTIVPSASTLNIVSGTGNMVFDVFDTFTNAAVPNTITPGGGQTVAHNAGTVTLGSGGFAYYRTSTSPGAASVPTSWTSMAGVALIHIGVNINAVASASSVAVSGRVLTSTGQGIKNAVITLADQNGAGRLARTNPFGYYSFDDVQAGSTYVLQVSAKGRVFANPTRVLHVEDDLTAEDFVALP